MSSPGLKTRRTRMIATLQDQFGEKVTFDPAILEAHGQDSSYPVIQPPEAVVFAESEQDVQKVLAWCRTNHMPLIPFGAGSSLEGHVTPISPVISLDFSRMRRVLDIRPQEFLVTVVPGITLDEPD